MNLNIFPQHTTLSDPLERDFDYAQAFKRPDLQAVKRDLSTLMTNSQD